MMMMVITDIDDMMNSSGDHDADNVMMFVITVFDYDLITIVMMMIMMTVMM